MPADTATSSPNSAAARSRPTSAARTQLYRDRRAKGLRCVILEVREREVDELVRRGLLQESDRDNPTELCRAIGRLLDGWMQGRIR